MIVRDAERQGYPFIEVARAGLSVCDELVVSDGFSTDRTWEGLLALRDVFPGRVRLFRDPWPSADNRGEVLGTMTNLVRRRCQRDYCLSIQANEVLHERSYAALAALPTTHPDVEVFALRYLGMVGPNLIWTETWRRRLFKNIPDIIAVGDAFEVSHVLPRRCPTRLCALPQPIYRYRTLFPVNFAVKLRSMVPRDAIFDKELLLVDQALADAAGRPDRVEWFWRRVRAILEEDLWEGLIANDAIPYPRWCRGTTQQAPAVLDHLLGGQWAYEMDHSLAALDQLSRRETQRSTPA